MPGSCSWASTPSTSTTRQTVCGRSTPPCSRPTSPSSNTCATSHTSLPKAYAFPRSRPRSPASAVGRFGPTDMSYRQTNVSGFPAVALRSDELEVVAVPTIGLKLTNLRRLDGREWLWRSDQIPLALPEPGTSYVETADSGGWDECFPTVGPSPLPGAPSGTPPLPDHGELWAAPWTSSVYEHADGVTLAGTAICTRLPYEFH